MDKSIASCRHNNLFFNLQIAVPRHSVGVVIGRSGEMIKKIQSDAGVKIQFKPGELSTYISQVGWNVMELL